MSNLKELRNIFEIIKIFFEMSCKNVPNFSLETMKMLQNLLTVMSSDVSYQIRRSRKRFLTIAAFVLFYLKMFLDL